MFQHAISDLFCEVSKCSLTSKNNNYSKSFSIRRQLVTQGYGYKLQTVGANFILFAKNFFYKTDMKSFIEIKRNIGSNEASLKQFVKIIKFSRFPIKRSIKNINGCIEPCDHVFLKRLKCFVALFHLVFTKRKAIISLDLGAIKTAIVQETHL